MLKCMHCGKEVKKIESIELEMGNLLKNPEKYLMKDKTYYIMCQSGARSNRTTKILNKQGYQVINVAGGVGSKYQLTGSVG